MKKTIIALAITATALSGCASMNQKVHADCTVLHKDVLQKVTGTKDSTTTSFERRLATSCGTFIVEDSLAGGFSSYDTWNQLQEGKVYDIKTGGYRVGFLGSFPTVVSIVPKGN